MWALIRQKGALLGPEYILELANNLENEFRLETGSIQSKLPIENDRSSRCNVYLTSARGMAAMYASGFPEFLNDHLEAAYILLHRS